MEALERKVACKERMREFVREALASDAAVEEGAVVYRAKDVHSGLERLVYSIQIKGSELLQNPEGSMQG